MSKPENKKGTLKRMFGRRFRAGGYSAFAAAVVVALAVLANLMVSSLPADKTQLDFTANAFYSLSEQSKQIAAAVDQDVDLYLICNAGNEDETISRLLDRYAGLSEHIRWSSVDPTLEPTFLDRYELELSQLYENSVLAVCGDRTRLVGYDEIFVTDYSMDYATYNYTTTVTFDGENALTTAIHYVASAELPKLYTLTGHGETELDTSVTEAIVRDGFETEALSLLSLEAVPEDADALLLNAPQSDLSEDEADMLIAYLERGGSIALLTGYTADGEKPQLRRVTQAMGLDLGTGVIIEGDPRMRMSRYPHYLLPELGSHAITDPLISGGYYILAPLAQPIVETGEGSAELTWLLTTSDSAYAKAAGLAITTTEKEDGDEAGPFHLGVIADGAGKLFWVSTDALLDGYIDSAVAGANVNLFLNALNEMCGQEESVSIRAKSMDNEGLTLTQAESSLWTALLIGVIPAALVAVGVIIWIRRKRR